MLKIGVIGRNDTVIGFKALGLDTRPVLTGTDALAELKSMTRDSGDYAIIYVEETFADAIQSEINRYKDSPAPAIILIPGREGSSGRGLAALDAAVERAVGTNILGDD